MLRRIVALFIIVALCFPSASMLGLAADVHAADPAFPEETVDQDSGEEIGIQSNNPDIYPYLSVGIILRNGDNSLEITSGRTGIITVTEYSVYSLFARYYTGEGESSVVTLSCAWTGDGIAVSSSERPASLDPSTNSLHTFEAYDRPIKFTGTYTNSEGRTFSNTCAIKIQPLTLSSDLFELQCAALSGISYTDFTPSQYYTTIGQLLYDMVPLKDKDVFISSKAFSGATFASFYRAAVGDYEIVKFTSTSSGMQACLFQGDGKYILAFRGTEPTTEFFEDVNKADILLGYGSWFTQLTDALAFYDSLMNDSSLSDTLKENMVLTGHSLGGGLANGVSALRNIRSITFNAPSTLVSAAHKSESFGRYYTGLDDQPRIDYPNENDWIGNTGIGDNSDSTRTNILPLGLLSKGGLLDPTAVVSDQSPMNGSGAVPAPHHYFNQLLRYQQTRAGGDVSIVVKARSHPEKQQVVPTVSPVDFEFGSKSGDSIFYWPMKTVFAFGGNGDDAILPDLFTPDGPRNVPSWLEYCLSIGFQRKRVFCGGRGNDVITGFMFSGDEYLFFKGDGFDRISDRAGNDDIRIYDYAESELSLSGKGYDESAISSYYEIIEKNSHTPLIRVYTNGLGTFRVYSGDSSSPLFQINKQLTGSKKSDEARIIVYSVSGPVDLRILDNTGNTVVLLTDSPETRLSETFGDFYVTEEDGTYCKTAVLFDSSYRVELVGTAVGAMVYSCAWITADDILTQRIETVSTANAIYSADSNPADDLLLRVDLNGDGLQDQVLQYITPNSAELNQAQAELYYGQSIALSAVVYPDSVPQTVSWSSSDPDVAFVDETGLVTAVGAGTAEITATSLYNSSISCVCLVTVSGEKQSIEDAVVEGLSPSYPYEGVPVEPEITVRLGTYLLRNGYDYSLEYTNVNAFGGNSATATVTITGIGWFEGVITRSYEILAQTVEQKAEQIYNECIDSGASTEYEIALWLHDWIIFHANYDYSFTEYYADGVLLKGTGVCNSYSKAYQLLLDLAGIENIFVSAPEMDHAWNIVKINGVYTHIDCTWDDPNSGGCESHRYFCIGDTEMELDHQWNHNAYPACEKITIPCTEDSLPDPYALSEPVEGVNYTLMDVSGALITREEVESAYHSTILIFGNPATSYSKEFVSALSDWKAVLDNHNVKVFIIFPNSQLAAAYEGDCPFACTYEADYGFSLWQFNQRIGLTGSYYTPLVVLQSATGHAYYYSTGYVYEPEKIVACSIQTMPAADPLPYSVLYTFTTENEMKACIQDALSRRITEYKLRHIDESVLTEAEINKAKTYFSEFSSQYNAQWAYSWRYAQKLFVQGVTYACLSHNYEDLVTPPTCTACGYTTHVCSICGHRYVDSYTSPLGHDWDEGVVTQEPSATEDGVKTFTCARCGATRTEAIPATGLVNPFVDVSEADWFYIPVLWAYYNEPQITAGTDPTHFSPGNTVTRAEAMVFFWAANGHPEPETTKSPFKDVKKSHWAFKAVMWAVENGITGGTDAEGKYFSPARTCTRSEILQFLYAAMGKPEYHIANPYSDVKNKHWYKDGAIWAYEYGLERGENGKFHATTPCTRAYVVTYLYRYFTGELLDE